MKKNLIYVLAVLLMAGITAHAQNDKAAGKNGKPDKGVNQAEKKASGVLADAEKAKAETEEKENLAKGKSKGRSEEMKKATAEKKEAQEAAKESGEKMDKEQKSWWKFWK